MTPFASLLKELASADHLSDLADELNRSPLLEPVVRIVHAHPVLQEVVDVLITPSRDAATQASRVLDALASVSPELAKALKPLQQEEVQALLHLLINRGDKRGGRRQRYAARKGKEEHLTARLLGDRGALTHKKLLGAS